jgi:gas vesicle protein
MSTSSRTKDHGDQEIIDLTEVVEEPESESPAESPEDPSARWQKDLEQAGERAQEAGHEQDPDAEEDFDFSAFMSAPGPDDEHTGRGLAADSDSASGQSSSPAGRLDDFEDIEDLFQELELGLSPDQATSRRRFGFRAGPQGLQESGSRSPEAEALHALESRIQRLEKTIHSGNRESWKDIENRIMSRLDELVQDRINKARESLLQEIAPAPHNQASDSHHEPDLRELAQKVEELNNFAVGPETVSALKNELWTELSHRIEETVPQAAAKVIREEIQALMDEEQAAASEGPGE